MKLVPRNHPLQVKSRDDAPNAHRLFVLPGDTRTDDVDDRGTEPSLFAELDGRYQFTVDVAAAKHNAKCARFYDRATNGLSQSWACERVWCNPPYSAIRPWIEKAWVEVDADVVVMLLPANRTEQGWWADLVEPERDRGGVLRTSFIRHRRPFLVPGEPKSVHVPFGLVVLIWDR